MGTDEHTNAHERGAAQEAADDERNRAAGLHRAPYASEPTPAGQIPRSESRRPWRKGHDDLPSLAAPFIDAQLHSSHERWVAMAMLARDVASIADHMASSSGAAFNFDPIDLVEDHLYRMSRLATHNAASAPPRFRMSMPDGLAEALNDLLACGYDADAQLPAIEAIVAIWRRHYADLERAIAAMSRAPQREILLDAFDPNTDDSKSTGLHDTTWSVVAELATVRGLSHTRVTVRRGVEGSRALIGQLVATPADVDAASSAIVAGARAVMTTAIKATCDALIDKLPPTMKVAELHAIMDTVARSIATIATEKLEASLVRSFNVRIDP